MSDPSTSPTPAPSPAPATTHGHGPNPSADKVEPPITREGFYALHQVYRVRWRAIADDPKRAQRAIADAVAFFQKATASNHSALYSVAGGKGDLMVVHFRPSFPSLNAVEIAQARLPIQDLLDLSYCYISVTEASGYDSARKRQEAMLRQQGLSPSDPAWQEAMQVIETQEAAFLKARLEPTIPDNAYACFYPMNKKRGEVKNWYKLTSRERGELMRGHAEVGRRWTDRVTQVITGSIGFDDYEWGVTLFADDPVLFKRLVYEMRFDPVSSDYAEFGPFMTGLRLQPADLPAFFNGLLPGVPADPHADPKDAGEDDEADDEKDEKDEKRDKKDKEKEKKDKQDKADKKDKEKKDKQDKADKDKDKDEDEEADDKDKDEKADDKKADA